MRLHENTFVVPRSIPELYDRYNGLVRKTLFAHDFERYEFDDRIQEVWVRWVSYDMLGAFSKARSVIPAVLTAKEAATILDLSKDLLLEALPCLHFDDGEVYFMSSDVLTAYDLLYHLDKNEPICVSGAQAVLLSGKSWSELEQVLKPVDGKKATLNGTYMFVDVPIRSTDNMTCPYAYFLDVTQACFENYLKKTVVNILRNIVRTRNRRHKETTIAVGRDNDPWENNIVGSTKHEFESYIESREILTMLDKDTNCTRFRRFTKESRIPDKHAKKLALRYDEFCASV